MTSSDVDCDENNMLIDLGFSVIHIVNITRKKAWDGRGEAYSETGLSCTYIIFWDSRDESYLSQTFFNFWRVKNVLFPFLQNLSGLPNLPWSRRGQKGFDMVHVTSSSHCLDNNSWISSLMLSLNQLLGREYLASHPTNWQTSSHEFAFRRSLYNVSYMMLVTTES